MAPSKGKRRDLSLVPAIDGAGADVPPATVEPGEIKFTYPSGDSIHFKKDGGIVVGARKALVDADSPEHPSIVTFMPEGAMTGWKPIEAFQRLRLLSNYAFYTDEGAFKAWLEGVIVTDPEEIELLTGRKAPVERIEE